MSKVQMEYSYHCGEPQSERMMAWYEGSLGFTGPASSPLRLSRCTITAMPQALGAEWRPHAVGLSRSVAAARDPDREAARVSALTANVGTLCCGQY